VNKRLRQNLQYNTSSTRQFKAVLDCAKGSRKGMSGSSSSVYSTKGSRKGCVAACTESYKRLR
jgi:hypothetical protein